MPNGVRWALGIAALLTVGVAVRVQGQQTVACDDGLREVRRLDFRGNTTYRDDQLANLIVTTPSTWARRVLRLIGTRYCYDSTVVTADAVRLAYFYNTRGFRGTTVKPTLTRSTPRAVAVRFDIVEGRPVLIDSLTFLGLDSVPNRDRILRGLPLRVGDRLDRALLNATRDSLTRRLRNSGYPTAEVLRNLDADSVRAVVSYEAVPGPRARIGSIQISVTKARGSGAAVGVHPARVRETLGIDSGSVFSERDLEGVKRGLYLTDAFQHVDVAVDSASLEDAVDSLVTVNVNLVEGQLHGARASLGGGNYDCLRVEGSLTTVNFLGGLRRVDLTGRLSRIGADRPFDVSKAICPSAGGDDFARGLNYYVGATYTQSPLFGRRAFPALTLYSERRLEFRTYRKDTPFGALSSLQLGGRTPVSLSYQLEFGRTEATDAYFCGVYNVCARDTIALLSQKDRRTGTVGMTAVRSSANDVGDPTRGSVTRFEIRHASPTVGSDNFVQFTRTSVDASWYFGVGSEGRFVLRARAGAVLSGKGLGASQRFVPPQERMYAGGPTTVRGYGPNELGSLVYQVDSSVVQYVQEGGKTYRRTLPNAVRKTPDRPTGGDNVVVLNAELRWRSPIYPELVQLAAFADAGDVWNRSSLSARSRFRQLKVTPGLGVRVFSPIGPLRMDVAYGPAKLTEGPVYLLGSGASGSGSGQVFCVSPGNQLAITVNNGRVTQEAGACPSTFLPPERSRFFRRLVFNFSIGQAF